MKKFDLVSPVIQYFLGVLLNILIIIILCSSKTSFYNMQVPEGMYSSNYQSGLDVTNYIGIAKNFLTYGVFGNENISSYHRTIGYPLFLSVVMKTFGEKWFLYLLFIQAILFALIYPSITEIIKIIFGNNRFLIISVFLFFLLTGTFALYTTYVLTDAMMTVLLSLGLLFGMKAIVSRKWKYFLFNILILGCATQIRPVLFLFGIINFFMLYSILRLYKYEKERKLKILIVISSLLILVLGNLPTITNYINYSILRPTDVLDENLFRSLGTKVLIEKNQTDTIDNYYSTLDSQKNVNERLKKTRTYAYKVFKEYPLSFTKIALSNAIAILFNNHLKYFANHWGYDWKDRGDEAFPIKKSNLVYILTLIFIIIYLFFYILLSIFLFSLVKRKDYLYALTIIMFICYFLIPSSVFSQVVRFRLPFESIIVIIAFYEMQRLYFYLIKQKTVKSL